MLLNDDADVAAGSAKIMPAPKAEKETSLPKISDGCVTPDTLADSCAEISASPPISPRSTRSASLPLSLPPKPPKHGSGRSNSDGFPSIIPLQEVIKVPSKLVQRPLKSCMSGASLDGSTGSRRRNRICRGSSMDSDDISVSFHTLEIREYERELGDNPSCSRGPSVAIGWRYAEPQTISVDEYEDNRLPRRESFQMVIPQPVREKMLLDSGHSRTEIQKAVKKTNITKGQRRKTANTLNMQKFEEVMESTGRKFKRAIKGKASTKKMSEWLMEAERASVAIQAEYEAADAMEDFYLVVNDSDRKPIIVTEED
uniref:Uncharacterized protein n=1 Tax=Corethron hystrix TaxID=216773 RepID=A0A7S1B2H3_9STRA|mmetsp:Transcript_10284/g.22846  ORF Transcript_10284/g.22846 Transcript_10284/m.22846 type:complete len:313 (+) Transcript_10284:67-1005(+)